MERGKESQGEWRLLDQGGREIKTSRKKAKEGGNENREQHNRGAKDINKN